MGKPRRRAKRKPRNEGGTVASILRRDRKCWLCGRGVSEMDASRDHVTPQLVGGYNKAANYRLAHRTCNSARGALPVDNVRVLLTALGPASTDAVCQALRKASGAWWREYGAEVAR